MGEDGHQPAWCLDHVLVTVNPGPDGHTYDHPALDGSGPEHRTWLEEMRGTVLHLRRRPEKGETREAAPAAGTGPEVAERLKQELSRRLLDNAHVVRATPQEIDICTGDDRGNRGDRDFHFQIIEQPRRGPV
ncbi:MAG TPA: hypothetical protein VK545_22080 [Streptomyces sp.]|nr:hypothetical protein [Streptomyces sp.]